MSAADSPGIDDGPLMEFCRAFLAEHPGSEFSGVAEYVTAAAAELPAALAMNMLITDGIGSGMDNDAAEIVYKTYAPLGLLWAMAESAIAGIFLFLGGPDESSWT